MLQTLLDVNAVKQYRINELFKTSWPELSVKEMIRLVALSEHITHFEPDSMQYGLDVINILRTLRKKNNYFYDVFGSTVSKINLDQAVDCFNDITFYRRTPEGNFKTPWLFFPVPAFNYHGVDYVPPKINGDTMPMFDRTFNQLVYADANFSAFCNLNNTYTINGDNLRDDAKKIYENDMRDCIASVIAILYTRPDEFDMNETEKKIPAILRMLSDDERALVLHTYANVRDYIRERCPNLFPKKENDAEPAQVQNTGEMWLNLRYDLADTPAFRGFTTALNTPLYDALDYLDKKAREAKQQQKEKDDERRTD